MNQIRTLDFMCILCSFRMHTTVKTPFKGDRPVHLASPRVFSNSEQL